MKNKWEILHDCDDDNGNPSVYTYKAGENKYYCCLLYTSPSPRDMRRYRMPSSA